MNAGAGACVQVLLGRSCSACLWACACVFVRTVETIAQSQCVTLGLVPRRSPFALALVYLRTKGSSETNDLAPVSQSRRTRDEKRKGSAGWGGWSEWWRLSDQRWIEQGAKQLREEGNEKIKFNPLERQVLNLAPSHQVVHVPTYIFPQK